MARAVVMSGKVVPVRLLNVTRESINLYSGAAVLSEVTDVMENYSGKCDRVAIQLWCQQLVGIMEMPFQKRY